MYLAAAAPAARVGDHRHAGSSHGIEGRCEGPHRVDGGPSRPGNERPQSASGCRSLPPLTTRVDAVTEGIAAARGCDVRQACCPPCRRARRRAQ